MEKGSWSACLSYALPTIKITWCRRADKSNISETNICGDRFVFFEWDCAFALLVTEENWQIIVGWLCTCIASHRRKLTNCHGSTVHMHYQSWNKATKLAWVNYAYALPVTKENHRIGMGQLCICVASHKGKVRSTAHMCCQSQKKTAKSSWVNCAYALPVTEENWQIVMGQLCICVASHKRKPPNRRGSTVHMRCQSLKKADKLSWINCAYALPVTKESWQIIMGQLRICVASHKGKVRSTVHMRCQSQKKTTKLAWVNCAYVLPVTEESWQIVMGQLWSLLVNYAAALLVLKNKINNRNKLLRTVHMHCQLQDSSGKSSRVNCAAAHC